MKLAIPAYFYPQRNGACLTGEAQRAPLGLPIAEVERATHGRGKHKVTRVLVRSAAPMVWAMVQRALKTDGWVMSVRAGNPRVRIGDYPLDRIDADGTLHAGCHTIPYSELAMMARALGLAS